MSWCNFWQISTSFYLEYTYYQWNDYETSTSVNSRLQSHGIHERFIIDRLNDNWYDTTQYEAQFCVPKICYWSVNYLSYIQWRASNHQDRPGLWYRRAVPARRDDGWWLSPTLMHGRGKMASDADDLLTGDTLYVVCHLQAVINIKDVLRRRCSPHLAAVSAASGSCNCHN